LFDLNVTESSSSYPEERNIIIRSVAKFLPFRRKRISILCHCVTSSVYILLGNDSVNTFPHKRTRATKGTRLLTNTDCFLCGPCRGVIKGYSQKKTRPVPCGGGIEYLHRDPASRRRRRKAKSQI
jgi:hypothetical protein